MRTAVTKPDTILSRLLNHKIGCFDPLTDDFLVLDALQVRLWGRPQRVVYYALDHRRLKCMRDAGCQRLRIRLTAVSSQVQCQLDAFVKKADLGLRKEIRVTKKRRRLA